MNTNPLARLVVLVGLALLLALAPTVPAHAQPARRSTPPLLKAPIWVYNDWSAYDELSDNVPLNETLAMRELDEILRLRKDGVRIDYYMMDAFWYDPDGGYRKWRAADWPQGPDRWLAALKANGIKPGLWFSTNTLTHMNAAPQWRDSLAENGSSMSLTHGGFLADFMDVLQYWYDRGIRMFKFDMADFDAIAAADKGKVTQQQARIANLRAFHAALVAFRQKNPDVVLIGFNGLVGDIQSEAAPVAWFDRRWLDVLDTIYSGDPRPSNVPEMNFWRSVDIYSDDMVRSMQQAGIPLKRIDSTSFMIGDTGTNYRRGAAAWQGSLLLMVAHGGWINTIHGSLEALDDTKAHWLAKVQALYDPLQRDGVTKGFGGIPGDAQPYGFGSVSHDGALYTVVNPSQRVRTVRLPQLAPQQPRLTDGRVLFRDAGFAPVLRNERIRLGPGQLALVGFGHYADAADDLGIEEDVSIPLSIRALNARFSPLPADAESVPPIETVLQPPAQGDLRIVLRQRDADGAMARSFGKYKNMGAFFTIGASQNGKPLPVAINYDKVIWSGLAWAVGEIRRSDIAPDEPIILRLLSQADDPSLHLEGQVFAVEYGNAAP
ncbi:MAG TPA: hypothetical protein VKV32_03795 [Stellaceae bacterium]|nr:hypothetical protein [Stellaceae bacterium]